MRFGWRPMWAFLISRSILGALSCQFLLSKLRADGEPAIGHEHRVAKLIAWYPIRSSHHSIPLLEPRRPSEHTQVLRAECFPPRRIGQKQLHFAPARSGISRPSSAAAQSAMPTCAMSKLNNFG